MTQIQTSFIPGAEFIIVSDNTYYYRINGKLATKLRLAAGKTDRPMAELVREALSAYLADQQAKVPNQIRFF